MEFQGDISMSQKQREEISIPACFTGGCIEHRSMNRSASPQQQNSSSPTAQVSGLNAKLISKKLGCWLHASCVAGLSVDTVLREGWRVWDMEKFYSAKSSPQSKHSLMGSSLFSNQVITCRSEPFPNMHTVGKCRGYYFNLAALGLSHSTKWASLSSATLRTGWMFWLDMHASPIRFLFQVTLLLQ